MYCQVGMKLDTMDNYKNSFQMPKVDLVRKENL